MYFVALDTSIFIFIERIHTYFIAFMIYFTFLKNSKGGLADGK